MKKIPFLFLLTFGFGMSLFGQVSGEGEAGKPSKAPQAGQKSLAIFTRVHVSANPSGPQIGATGPRIAYQVRNAKLNQHRFDGGFSFGGNFSSLTNSMLYLGMGYEFQWFYRKDKSKSLQPYLGVGTDLSYRFATETDWIGGSNRVHRLALTPRIVPGMEIHLSRRIFLDIATPINPVSLGARFNSSGANEFGGFENGSPVNLRLGLGIKF